MLKVPKPTLLSADVYTDCIGIFQDVALRARLEACKPLIADAETEFEAKITRGQIYTIAHETVVNGNVTKKELKKVYSDQMLKSKIGRTHYNKLLKAAKGDLCPLCAHREATTLDHYLPKAKYPRLSVVPINLVPACRDCNTGKLTSYPRTPEEESIHPYYDDIESDQWLGAKINRTTPLSITFYVVHVAGWSGLLFERTKNHFLSYKLNTLYATQAGRELTARKHQYTSTYHSGAGAAGVKKLLADESISRSQSNINSWQSALYRCLASDDWFCNGGFDQIED